MPRAALLSIHARIEGTEASTWEDPSLVQVWGPRFSAYVVPAIDRAIFTLSRLPDEGRSRAIALDMADRLDALLAGRTMSANEAGHALGLDHPNQLRYAALTGRVLIRWDGAKRPTIWTVPAPDVDPLDARAELARRYLHVFGPGTAEAFAEWAGIKPPRGRAAFEAIGHSLTAVQNSDRRRMDPFRGRGILQGLRRDRRPPLDSCPAATPITSSRDPLVSSWCRRRTVAAPCGPPASGRARF